MSFETLLTIEIVVGAAIVAVTARALLAAPGTPRHLTLTVATLVALLGGGALALLSLRTTTTQNDADFLNTMLPRRPDHGRAADDFVTSDACRACHPGAYDSWYRTWHRTMTQVATPETALGDFDDVTLSFDGRTRRLLIEDGKLWIEGPDPDWEFATWQQGQNPDDREPPSYARSRVIMSTGSHHQQAYWIPSRTTPADLDSPRLLFNFPFIWLKDRQRWVPREAVFLRPPDAMRLFQTWNTNCINCHAVAGQTDIDPHAGTMHSEVAELGISCEACHGPAAPHLAVNHDPSRRYRAHYDAATDPTIVQPANLDPPRSAEVCGQCHSITMPRVFDGGATRHYHAGETLADTRVVIRATDRNLPESERAGWAQARQAILGQNPAFYEQRYWDDGMVRVSGREYNGLLESPCYQAGTFSCLDCHSMHAYDSTDDMLKPGMRGNTACLQCHESIGADIPAHTHHRADSPGSDCMNCHMAHTVTGLAKVIRSHEVASPSVAANLASGRPNACSLCHLDQSLEWVATALESWYGLPVPSEMPDHARTVAAGPYWMLTGDAGLRAVVAGNAGLPGAHAASDINALAPFLGQLLDDPYAVVRSMAEDALRTQPTYGALEYDFVGPASARRNAADAVVAAWRATEHRADALRLVRADGTIDRAMLDRLLAQRDDRPMDLQE